MAALQLPVRNLRCHHRSGQRSVYVKGLKSWRCGKHRAVLTTLSLRMRRNVYLWAPRFRHFCSILRAIFHNIWRHFGDFWSFSVDFFVGWAKNHPYSYFLSIWPTDLEIVYAEILDHPRRLFGDPNLFTKFLLDAIRCCEIIANLIFPLVWLETAYSRP